ncbi:hypothetical protein HNQ56_002254 [Anaerotaenia torta]|uniref:hypothetical protein n=1 Tax=Anaerotaenia torta TaxID=433293 RepID=UPI003D1EBDB9
MDIYSHALGAVKVCTVTISVEVDGYAIFTICLRYLCQGGIRVIRGVIIVKTRLHHIKSTALQLLHQLEGHTYIGVMFSVLFPFFDIIRSILIDINCYRKRRGPLPCCVSPRACINAPNLTYLGCQHYQPELLAAENYWLYGGL